MHTTLIITFVGRDRPGLVEGLARVISQHGGNWLESRLAQMAGQFAGIIEVSLPTLEQAALEQALDALAGQLDLSLQHEPAQPALRGVAVQVHALNILGQDRPGIVRDVAQALADRGINVREFNSGVTSAPMSAEHLFSADVLIEVPQSEDLDALRARLEELADSLMLDVTLE